MVTILFLCIFTHDATGRKTSNIVLKNPSSAALKFYGLHADIGHLSNRDQYVNETHWPFATGQPTIPVYNSRRENQSVITDVVVTASPEAGRNKIPYAMIWVYGVISTTAINICATLGAICKPFMKKRYFPWILMGMIGIGVGSMLSASVLTLIPAALFAPVNSDTTHKVCILVATIFLCYLISRMLKLVQYNQKEDDDPSTESDPDAAFSTVRKASLSTPAQRKSAGDPFSVSDAVMRCIKEEIKVDLIPKTVKGIKDVPVTVWMILFGDGLHNIVHGLAIGAAFVHDAKAGLRLVLAILFEKIPCELGEFAVLLKAGLSVKMTVILNFAAASTNYIGLIIGILVGDLKGAHSWIYAIAAGMFLYISLSMMIAELLDLEGKLVLVKQNSLKSKRDERKIVLRAITIQNITLKIGFLIQLAIILATAGKH